MYGGTKIAGWSWKQNKCMTFR